MAATSKRQRVLFMHEPQTPANRLPTINLIEATPSTPSSSTSSALAPRTVGGRPSVRRVVPRTAKTPSRLPVPVSKRPTTGAVRHAPAIPETPPPLLRPSMAEKSAQDGPRRAPAKIPVKPHKRSLKPLHLLQRAAEAKRKESSKAPDPPDSPGFVEVGIADTPPSDLSANPSANSSLSRVAPPIDDPDISEVVIVPKLKKRPGLDFDWARGGAPAPEFKPTEGQDNGRPASVRIPDKTSWWSTLGRGRKKEKENEIAERGSLRSLLRSRATSTEPESDTQSPRKRTNTLTGALLLVLPKPHVAAATDMSNLPPTTSQESLRGSRAPKSRNGTTSSVVSTSNRSDAPSEGTVKNGSLALRAIRSVRSLASVWGKNGGTKEKEGKESKQRNGSQVSVASGSFSATEARGAPRKRGATLNAKGLPVAPVAGRHTAARAGPSRKQNATTDLTRQSSDTFSAESSGSRSVSGASILSTGRRIRFSTDSPAEIEVAKNADAYAGCTFVNQDPDEDATRTSRTSKSSTSIRWSEHVLEAEREKARRKSREVMRRVSAPLPMFNQSDEEEKMLNIESKKRAPLAGLFDVHIPSPSSSQVEFSPVDEQCEVDYRSSSQRRWSMADLDPSQSSRRPSTSDYIDPNVRNEGSIRSAIIPRPRTASEIFLDRIRPSSMFEPELRESDSALPYLNATASDLESLAEDPESPPLTPNGTLFKSTRRGAITHSSPLDAHSSDESLRDSLRASTMTVRPSKTTKTPPPGRLILPEPQVDQNPDSDPVEAEPIVDLFESEPSAPAPAAAPDSPVFARLTAPPVRRPSAGLLERVVAWRSANKESKEPKTPIAPVRSNSVLQPKQRPATDEATPQLSGFRIRPGIVSRAVSIFDSTLDTASTQRAPVRPLRLKRASIVSQGHSSTANSSGMPSPSDRTFGEPPDRPVTGYFEEDEGYPSQPRLHSRKVSVRERVASIDKLAHISNGLENPRTRGFESPEGKEDLGSVGSIDSEVQEDGLDDDDESVLGSDIPDDLRAELSSQASPPLRFEDLSSSLTERRSTRLLPPDLASSQVRVEEELYSSWASRPSFDFSAEIARVGLDKHLLGDLKASFAELMDDADDETAHIQSESVGFSRSDAYDAAPDLQAVLRSGPSKRVAAPGSTLGLPKDLATLRARHLNHVPNEAASLRSTQSSLVWRASLSSRLSAGRASSDDNISLALSFKIAPIQRAAVSEADGHIIDLGEDEGDEIFFRSTSSRPRSRSSLGDSHGRPVPHVGQGTSISALEVEREHNAQDVLLSLRNPTQVTWTVEDIFGPQTGGHHRPPGNDAVATTSSLGAVPDDVKADPHLLGLHSSTTSASSGTTIDDTFSFTRKTVGQGTLSCGGAASHTLRLDAQTRYIRPQDQLRLSVPYGARPPTGFTDHYTAGLASSIGSRASDNEESEKSSLEIQSDAQQGASPQDSGTPSATGSGSDLSISALGRPGVGDKMFTSPAALESDTVSEPTIFPGVGTLIDPIIVGAEGEDSKGPHLETPLVSVDQNEQLQPSASNLSPSAPTSTSQPFPLMSLPESSSRAMQVKPLELPLLEEQSMDLRAILMSGRKRLPGVQAKTRRRSVIQAPLIPQTDDEVEDTLDQSRGCEELPMDMSFKHDSEQFEKEATSFSTVVIDSVVDKSRLKRPPPKARTRRQNWNKTPQKPKTSRSSGASKDKKKSRPTPVVRKAPNSNSPSLAKENRVRQGMRPTAHNRRRDITQSQMSVVREIIKELQEEAPELCDSPTHSHHSSASDYSLASPRRVPNSAVDIVGGTDSRIFKFGRYSTLRQEAEEEVNRSRYVWEDTPFSVYALNSFHPPNDRRQITEFLDYSQKNYISLPREYRRKNRRSRFSPSKGTISPLKRSTNSQDRKRRSVAAKGSLNKSQGSLNKSQSSPTKSQGSPASVTVTVTKPPIFTKPTSSSVVHIRSMSNCPKNIFTPPRDAPGSSKQPTAARSSVKSRDTSKEIGNSTLNGESEAQAPLARAPDQPRLAAKPRPRGRVTPLNNSRSKLPPFRV